MVEPVVELDCVEKDFAAAGRTVTALIRVSLRVPAGDFLAITGPSGSGKSTLLSLVGCLDVPTRGRVLIDGIDVSTLSDDQRAHLRRDRLGFVFQQFNLVPRMSAADNVGLPLVYSGVPRRRRLARAREMLARVGLAGRTDHLPSQLSGGEQQRVAIARALINEPLMLLADEPTGSLDRVSGDALSSLLRTLNQEGTTIVLVTHDAELARRAGRHLRFRDGQLTDTSSPPAGSAP